MIKVNINLGLAVQSLRTNAMKSILNGLSILYRYLDLNLNRFIHLKPDSSQCIGKNSKMTGKQVNRFFHNYHNGGLTSIEDRCSRVKNQTAQMCQMREGIHR